MAMSLMCGPSLGRRCHGHDQPAILHIAPASMQADTVAWDAGKTLIYRRDMPLELLQERPLIELRKEAGALHRQVGCIDLQHMPRFVDRSVLVGERLRHAVK